MLQLSICVTAAHFQQQHADAGILGQPTSHNSTGRAQSTHDNVILLSYIGREFLLIGIDSLNEIRRSCLSVNTLLHAGVDLHGLPLLSDTRLIPDRCVGIRRSAPAENLAEFLTHFRNWTLMFAWPLLRTLPVHGFSPGLLIVTS